MNNKGFTLIELLAVITIMGILMMVAIPNVSRTIENSRRDTFADNAVSYVEAVRKAVLADELKCGTGSSAKKISAMPDGSYYFKIDTTEDNTKDLMEKVAKSSWGQAEMVGYVSWVTANSKSTYSIILADTGKHGMTSTVAVDSITRADIKTQGADTPTAPSGYTVCTYVG